MGNIVGTYYENGFKLYFHPDETPHPLEEPTFDPLMGFTNGRKERVMVATEEQMQSAKIRLRSRDYCAHVLLKFLDCRREKYPWVVKCEHEKHAYMTCQYEDTVIRMKEYERERRLRLRDKEIKRREIAAE